MTSIERYNHAKFVTGRFDHYFNIVNSKGSFYIALNTFLLGGLFTGFTSVYRQVDKPLYLWILLILFSVSSLSSIGLTILAINPFLLSGNRASRERSLLFFGSVAEYEKANYVAAFREQDSDRMLSDTVNQNWMLAKGLVSKYARLKIAGYLLIFQFVLLVPIVYFITSNFIEK